MPYDSPTFARPAWPDLSLVFAPDRVLFRGQGGSVTGHGFLYAAHALAARLPDRPVVIMCREVRAFTLLFAATLLRGQHAILSSDRTSAHLGALAARHGAICATIADDPESGHLPEDGLVFPDPFHGAYQPGMALAPNPVLPPDRLVALVFTSGSTGEPVGHVKHWGALVARSVVACGLLDPDLEAASLIGTVPPYHMYGFETLVLQTLHTRVTAITGPDRYPADWQGQFEQASVPRILITTPLQLRSLARAGLAMPPIRRVVSAAAPLPDALAAEAERALQTEVMEIYGATETGSVATRRTLDGPCWRLYDGIVLDVADGHATIAAPGAAPHPLSDLVAREGARGFRLLGRVGDVVKLAGKRASLAALNATLLALDGVEDGAFLAPDEAAVGAWARMRAFAVAPGRDPDELLNALRARIEPAFLPRRIHLVPAMPRNAVGKLTVQALRGLADRTDGTEELGTFSLPPDHPALPGHFPGQPVVPGVLLVLGGLACLERAGLSAPGLSVSTVKFVRPVLPGQVVAFSARRAGDTVRLTGRNDGEPVLQAILRQRSGS
ncbi:AMP-binding protein [Acidomonas methanolica]|uniref:Uncharacterized protein n=1 Tax=Acidomonas methanolica NBRC 104435 TaxID=1231351 RepID=A0A023D938_ACIMT|nr:AMP-binding protein [Acidomonas methanolica]MBU2653792.1 AMP-binding protein [Acidomonas methanolica]TCS31746.1 acyl-coenzyme A synthetase/AMP-(fatty) acid ligase [Acidomonas methanolica]GAJ30210.1 hypothetical protein Amme_111_035 [Acidomonas methanolica NBRC 104435]GBQ51452.1 acyl-coenzyme A synthetase [Acidomonas methanolica]GEK98162.1 AMP-ligase [Acidomonas methanolica NBRC 104435]